MMHVRCRCGALHSFSIAQSGDSVQCNVCQTVFEVPDLNAAVERQPTSPIKHAKPFPQKHKTSSIAWAIPAFLALGLVLAAMLVTLIGFVGVSRVVTSKVSSVANPIALLQSLVQLTNPQALIDHYESEGYQHQLGQVITENELVEDKKFYTCQVLQLEDGASSNVAILSQVARLEGDIQGDVDFFGQQLEVAPGAVIHGDVNLKFAQHVAIRGTVKGKLTGRFQVLDGKDNIEEGVDNIPVLDELIDSITQSVAKDSGFSNSQFDSMKSKGIEFSNEGMTASNPHFFDGFLSNSKPRIQSAKFIDHFQSLGFNRIDAQGIDVSKEISEPTLFTGQSIRINGQCDSDLAIIGQRVEIEQDVLGDVFICCQSFTLGPNCKVHGDIHVFHSQSLIISGKVTGKLMGSYQSLHGSENIELGVEEPSKMISLFE